MRRIGVLVVVGAVAAAAAGTDAAAQVLGIPYYPTPTGTGVSVAADYGNPEGAGQSIALTAGLGISRLGFTATVGTNDPGGALDREVLYGATAAMKLFGGGLNPVTIGVQAGLGRTEVLRPIAGNPTRTVALTNIPVGATVRVSPPLFPLKPFAVAYYTFGDFDEEFRVTVGANFNLILGLGVHGAYDWGDSGSTWGVGAHINLRLPGLPGVPGM